MLVSLLVSKKSACVGINVQWGDGLKMMVERLTAVVGACSLSAVLAAEIIHFFYPKLIEMHNYSGANAYNQKIYNWQTLNSKGPIRPAHCGSITPFPINLCAFATTLSRRLRADLDCRTRRKGPAEAGDHIDPNRNGRPVQLPTDGGGEPPAQNKGQN